MESKSDSISLSGMTTYKAWGIVLAMTRASTAFALVSLGLAAAIAASAQTMPQSPAISVSTRLVQVGVIVRDKNGPVADLTKEDFVVLDRGKPQKISVFSVESSASAAQACAAVAAKHVLRSSSIRHSHPAERDHRSARQFEYFVRFRADHLRGHPILDGGSRSR